MVKRILAVGLCFGALITWGTADGVAADGPSGSRLTAEDTSIVSADGSGDYRSLKDAFTALSGTFSNAPDHTLLIASDLLETQPLVLQRHSGLASGLTIKPLGGPRTIVVTNRAVLTAGPGALAGIDWNLKSGQLCNAVIDGTLAGHDHGLNLIFAHDGQIEPRNQQDYGFAFGGNGSVEIRNCRIEHHPISKNQSSAVYIHTGVQRPVSIVDNQIQATDVGGCGMLLNVKSTNPADPAADVLISGNIITAAHFGIGVYKRDAVVERNNITITGVPGSLDSLLGIAVNRHSSPTTTTLISRNRVVIQSGDSALVSQGIRTYSGSDHAGTLKVENNMVSMNLDTAPETRAVRGITSVNRRGAVNEIAHNSLFLPGNQFNNEETARNFHGLGIDAVSSNSITLANNMVRVGSRWGSGMFLQHGTPVVSDGNVIGLAGEAVAVTTDETTYTVLADWQSASGMDTNSQSFDPLPSWGSPDNLHLVNSVAGLEPGVTGILQMPLQVDFDGDARSATVPTPGADERDLAAPVRNWSIY